MPNNHLASFSSVEEYELGKEKLSYPNVTYIVDSNTTIFTKNPPMKFIDMGLSVKWAECNLGATKPEEYGLFYAWGETDGYSEITDDKKFAWSDYKYSMPTTANKWAGVTKYNSDAANGVVDNLSRLLPEDDAATAFDNTQRTPTQAEWLELVNNCDSKWVTVNGVQGKRLTSKINGNSIFFPSTGYLVNGSHSSIGTTSHYYTSELSSSKSAYFMTITNGSNNISNSFRCYGRSIRAVK